ncbi:hypothetical protein [Pseudochelatococcus contaminans]|uniref:Uncharacterized protein n=1 Tax=Pseudochelatococcus contaminans TaxID=1538103 RepID=A0A7W5Z5C8_9HYPH|nr:hypothetical protein [Pseudochelatococcus contaminans]MBB3809987.1 hypothetical protein [Pseudochelatococcus contaminans]
MTIKQSKADSIFAAHVRADFRQPKQVVPHFRELGIPALAAAARQQARQPAETARELPHFLQLPQKG